MQPVTVRDHIKAPQCGLDRVKLSIQHGPLGSFDREDGERIARLLNMGATEVTRLRQALEEIEIFGYNNSGYGFSCARMATKALGK